MRVVSAARRGFTLIEMIGVLTIMAVAAAFLAPNLVRQIQSSSAAGEDAVLREIGDALIRAIQATGRIPNPNVSATAAGGWANIAQAYSTMPANAFLRVFPNNSSTERRYYLEPVFDNYLLSLPTPYATPPSGFPGVGFPGGALRVLLVSSSRGIENPPSLSDPVLPGAAGVNLPAADQTALVNWTKISVAGVVSVPILPNNPFSANWNNLGQFLHVRALDLRPLFCRVQLTDTAAPEDIAGFVVSAAGIGYPPSSTIKVNFNNNTLAFTSTPEDTFVDNPHLPQNGTYDIGEPFTDSNSNGNWDAGEAFLDGVGNGIYDPSDTFADNNGDQVYSLSGGILTATLPAFSNCSDYNARHGILAGISIPPGTARFDAPVSPAAPTYDTSVGAGPGAGVFLPSPDPAAPAAGLNPDHNQTKTFYVLKGRSINLFNGAGVLDKSVVIQTDAQYRYFNNTWTRVD